MEMLNVSIKKEKDDANNQENVSETSNVPAPTRIISLKTTKARQDKTAKGKSSVDKIKVKTLDEIRKEKKIKTQPCSNEGKAKKSLAKPSSALMYNKLNLKQPSIRLMPLPNGQHSGQRTFKVTNILKNESSETQACPTVKIKQEPPDNDIHMNHENDYEASAMENDSFDLNSETSSELLGSSFDFSDVPRGTAQDEDTMSLFAHDDTFEEESEPDKQQSGRHSIGRSTKNPSTDLRETLQNHSAYKKEENEIAHYNSTMQEEQPNTDDKNNWEKRPKHPRQKKENFDARNNFNNMKKKRGKGKGKFGKQQSIDRQNYIDECKRLQLLHDMVKVTTIKRGVIPQIEPTLTMNTEVHYNQPAVGTGQERETWPIDQAQQNISQFKIRPKVPGGRGFFEDVPSGRKKEVTQVNGNVDRFRPNDKKGASKATESDKNRRKSNEEKRHSPRGEDPELRHTLKRQSSGDEKSPKRSKPNKTKQEYCTTQLLLGKCHHSYCRLKHLSPDEFAEYKRTGEIIHHEHQVSNDEQVALTQEVEINELPEQEVVHEGNEEEIVQLCRGVAGAARQALNARKISEAWQLIYHLYEIAPPNDPALIMLVERVLVLCGQEGVDADVAAQVSSKAFDIIPKVRGNYNRHDFTNLIRCLGQTGQYLRAYEAYDEMKALKISPTHEVFLDLINSSQDIPDRAFDLLDEIKSVGLFRSSICNALINLSCKTDKPIFERAWLLFKNMTDNSIKPSKELFLVFLELLANHNQGQKIIEALIYFDDCSIVPSPNCNKVLIYQCKDNQSMVSIAIASVCTTAEHHNPQLDVETWNTLLSNCYSENFNFAIKAQEIQRLMKKFHVPFLSQGYNGLLCSLSEGNLTIAVMEVFKDLVKEQVNVKDCIQGINAAVSALVRAKQIEDLVEMVFVLTDRGIMVEEKAYLVILEEMENKKQYKQMHHLFQKCQDAEFVLPIALFRKLISALEKWAENPAASLEVYATMKTAFPIIPDSPQSHSSNENISALKLTPKSRSKDKPLCKFFLQNRCMFGDTCRFSHLVPEDNNSGATIKKEISIPEGRNPFVLRSNILPEEQMAVPLPLPPPPPFPITMAIPPPVFGGSGSFVLRDPSTFPNFPQPALTETFGVAKHLTPPGLSSSIQGACSASGGAHETDVEKQTQSAPELSNSVKEDGFKFPSKTEVEFYKERVSKASEEQNFEELARLYVEMKTENVPVCKEMLKLFYSSFTTFSNIGESLSSFVAIIDIQLDNPDVSDDSSARESLDSEDQKFIGELGVALMQLCKNSNRLDEGYLVLHVLHQYNINYFQYPASFLGNGKSLSSPSIALLAADMCLCLEKDPQYDGAVEVLRGCNYALPIDGEHLTQEEAEKRRETFQKVTDHCLDIGNYAVVYEFLQQVGDKVVFGMTYLKSIYNELLKKYIDDKKVEDAIGIIRVMESEMISRDTNVLRSLINCLGSTGRFVQAKEIFKSTCLQGAYPAFPQGDGLWSAMIWSSFSKFEIQFYLEQHLQHLNSHVEEQRMANQMPYGEKNLRPLRIIILEEEPNMLTTDMTIEVFQKMHDKVIEILGSDFNPPLSCGVSDKMGEVIVNPHNLRRWFLANPSAEAQISPPKSEDVHQRNVMASEGQLSIRLDVSRASDQPNNNGEGHVDNKSSMDKIKHTICGHLTRFMRNGLIGSKEFKGYARVIAEDYFRKFPDIPIDYNKHERTKVVAFVDKYFEKAN